MSDHDTSVFDKDNSEESQNMYEHLEEDEDVSQESQNMYEHLEEEGKVADHVVELVAGEKAGSEWLVLDNIYILHKKDTTSNEKDSSSHMYVLIIVIFCLVFIILIVVSIVAWMCVKNRQSAKKAEEVDWNPEYGNENYNPEYQESAFQDQMIITMQKINLL